MLCKGSSVVLDSVGAVAACAQRSARRLCGTCRDTCMGTGVKCNGAAGVEEHVQRSGGAVIMPYWQRSGSAEVCALRAQCDFSLGLRCQMGTRWLRHCFECAECGHEKTPWYLKTLGVCLFCSHAPVPLCQRAHIARQHVARGVHSALRGLEDLYRAHLVVEGALTSLQRGCAVPVSKRFKR